MKKRLFFTGILTLSFLAFFGCEFFENPSGPSGHDMPDGVSVGDLGGPGGGAADQGPHMGKMSGQRYQTFISREYGGLLDFDRGRLDIPANSINQSQMIWARNYFMRGNILKTIYEFGPSGTVFDPSAELTLSYKHLGSIEPDSITLMLYNEETGEWEAASEMTHNPANRSFTGSIQHFSRYSLSANGQKLEPAD